MSDPERTSVVDDPAATRRVLGVVRFSSPAEMAAAVQWLLASPSLEAARGDRLRTDLRLEAVGSGGYAKLVYFWRETVPGVRSPSQDPDRLHVVVISNKAD